MAFEYDNDVNHCRIGENVQISGFIRGRNNSVEIESPVHECRLDLRISGNNNSVIVALRRFHTVDIRVAEAGAGTLA